MLWLAPIPALAIAPRLSTSAAFLLGSGAWLLGALNEWNYVRHEIEAPVFLFAGAVAALFSGTGKPWPTSRSRDHCWLDRWLHARMAVMRAVENGFALARSARNGLLTLSDNRGRIIAEAATVSGRFVSLTGNVNVAREETFYAQTGDWFAWLCVITFVTLLACLLFTRSSVRQTKATRN
jgi:hypothetical protein